MFLELDTRQDGSLTVSLEWDNDTGDTQIVVYDSRTAIVIIYGVSGRSAAAAFRDPFSYAPRQPVASCVKSAGDVL